MPWHRAAEYGWRTTLICDSEITPYGDSYLAKGILIRRTLEASGKIVSHGNTSEDERMLVWKPILARLGLKTLSSFDSKSLSFSISLDENGYSFCPHEYQRGGFSGIRDSKFTIPADASDEELGKTIDRALSYCIGKGGKRLEDFLQDAPQTLLNPQQDLPAIEIANFGYKNMWFAIKSIEPLKVAHALGFRSPQEIDWDNGVEAAYEKNAVFITPPIDNWILAVGGGLLTERMTNEILLSKTKSLSQEFGEAQFFSTHRVTETHVWIKAIQGEIVRAYAYSGESGENFFVEGKPTPVERQWDLVNTLLPEAEDEEYWDKVTHPDEDTVMKVAESWSVNPMELSSRDDISSNGWLG